MDFEVSSKNGPYQVVFDRPLDAVLTSLAEGDKAWLLVDKTVADHNREAVNAAFPDQSGRVLEIEATEVAKSYDHVEGVFTWLLENGFRRDCVVVALGGGIIQDIAGYVATLLMRGVQWAFIPSTLLAQCDSCIGAKSSINVGKFKNQLGSFHAPKAVYIIPELLKTLPERDRRSGFGEIAKFHLVKGGDHWQHIQSQLCWDSVESLRPLIHESLRIKKAFIEEDEFDTGIRNLLNYGHTFGHAFESATGFEIPHGLAVALGIAAATYVSEQIGVCPQGHFDEVNQYLAKIYRSDWEPLLAADVDAIVRAMKNDKKNVRGQTFAILTRGPGQMEKMEVDLESAIPDYLKAFTAVLNASKV